MQVGQIIEISCSSSHSSVKNMKFKVKRAKMLDQMRQTLAKVFELENLGIGYKFYYKGNKINSLNDLKSQQINQSIQLRLQFYGG